MNRRGITILFVICVFSLGMIVSGNVTADNKMKATDFSLKDQFGTTHEIKFPREKVTILAFADKDGSEQLEGWIRPLYERYTDKIDIYGVAELSSVPLIARGIVRGIIKKGTNYPVMLDWEGKVSKAYSYEKDKANIYLISKTGTVVLKKTGVANEKELNSLYKEIDQLLKSNK